MPILRARRSVALLAALTAVSAAAGDVEGRVETLEGKPLAAAKIDAHLTTSAVMFRAVSDKEGRYRVEGLRPGKYEMQLKAPGYRAMLIRLSVEAEVKQLPPMALMPEPPGCSGFGGVLMVARDDDQTSISGQVKSGEGNSLSEVDVSATPQPAGAAQAKKAGTLKDGRFRLGIVPPANYELSIQKDKYVGEKGTVRAIAGFDVILRGVELQRCRRRGGCTERTCRE